jgi:hypothetical protein
MKKWLFVLLLSLAVMPREATAQGCSICTKTASELGEKPAQGLNKGILYLALLPLTILGGLGYFWYRAQRVS